MPRSFLPVLLLSASLASASVTVTPPLRVAPQTLGAADAISTVYATVSDGQQTVAFSVTGESTSPQRHLIATRLSNDGRPIDSQIIATFATIWDVAAAKSPAGGSLVVWSNSDGAFIRHVSASFAASEPIRLGERGYVAEISCNDANCIVVKSRDFEVEMLIVDPQGRPLTSPVPIPNAYFLGFTAAGSGDSFLVAHRVRDDWGTSRVLLVSPNGSTIATIDRAHEICTVSSDSEGYALACVTGAGTARLSLLDRGANSKASRDFDFAPPVGRLDHVRAVSSAGGFLLVAQTEVRPAGGIPGSFPAYALSGLRIARNLEPADHAAFPIGGPACSVFLGDATTTASGYVIAWNHNDYCSSPVALSGSVPFAGAPIPTTHPLHIRPLRQWARALAASGSHRLVVWLEQKLGRRANVRAIMLTDRGHVEPTPIDAGEGYGFTDVVAASDGRDFLLAWIDEVPITGTSVGRMRTARVDGLTREVTPGDSIPGMPGRAMVSDGTSYFVPVSRGSHLVVARFSTDGRFIDEFTVDPDTYPRGTIAWSRGSLLVAYGKFEAAYARVFTTTGQPRHEAVQLRRDLAFDFVATPDRRGFVVLMTSGTADAIAISLDGQKLQTTRIPSLDYQSAVAAGTINGRAVFVGERPERRIAVFSEVWEPIALPRHDNEFPRFGAPVADRRLGFLTQRTIGETWVVEYQELVFDPQPRNRAVRR